MSQRVNEKSSFYKTYFKSCNLIFLNSSEQLIFCRKLRSSSFCYHYTSHRKKLHMLLEINPEKEFLLLDLHSLLRNTRFCDKMMFLFLVLFNCFFDIILLSDALEASRCRWVEKRSKSFPSQLIFMYVSDFILIFFVVDNFNPLKILFMMLSKAIFIIFAIFFNVCGNNLKLSEMPEFISFCKRPEEAAHERTTIIKNL